MEAFQTRVEAADIPVHLRHRCLSVPHEHGLVTSIRVRDGQGEQTVVVDSILSSIPLSELVLSLDPPPPVEVRGGGQAPALPRLCARRNRDRGEQPFPDNWIYLHDPGTRAGRVQNFGAWSPTWSSPGTTCLGVEYFCFEGDDIWEISEAEAIALATEELARIGLVDPAKVVGGASVHVPRAYPMYDGDYRDAVLTLKGYLAGFENLKTFGRNGLHRYNNQDHSMWTAVLATLNLVDGTDPRRLVGEHRGDVPRGAGEVLDALVDLDLVC